MGYRRIYIGLLFFLNPNISYVDLLPDFIGCLFILSGLSSLLFLDERAREARRYVRFLALVSVVRLVLTPAWFSSAAADGSDNMLFSFCFGVVTILLELALVRELFSLYNYLANRRDSVEGIRYLEAAQSALTVFVFVKNIAAMLPDTLTLFAADASLEYNYNAARQTENLNTIKFVATVVLAAAVLGFGVYVAVKLRRFFMASSREKAFIDRLQSEAAVEERDNRSLRIRFIFYGCFTYLVCMALFSVDYYLDYISVLPSMAVFVFLFCLLQRLRVYRKPKPLQYVLCAAGFLITGAAYVYRVISASGETYIAQTFYLQTYTVLLGVLQCAFCIAGFVAGAFWLCKEVERQTGIDLAPPRNIACVFCALSCGVNAYNYIMPKGGAVTDLMEFYALLNIVVGLTFVFFTYRVQMHFRSQEEWKSF